VRDAVEELVFVVVGKEVVVVVEIDVLTGVISVGAGS
jgi:hypothetical protein